MRIKLHHLGGKRHLEVDLPIKAVSEVDCGTVIYAGDQYWTVRESVNEIKALEAAAKERPVAAPPKLPWECCDFAFPWRVRWPDDGSVEIWDAGNRRRIVGLPGCDRPDPRIAQAIEYMVACTNLAAKAPPAEEAEWQKRYPLPLSVVADANGCVALRAANGNLVAGPIIDGSTVAALYRHIAKCVHKREAD